LPVITCEAVIAEACYLLRRLRGASDAVLANVERGNFVVPFRLDESAAAIRTLMKRYASVAMDLADACLVQLATVLNIGDVLTLDDDFHVYRFGRARAFRLLPERA
jgi:predicted nucleic acid-binding protein